jgi:hypothetical protein
MLLEQLGLADVAGENVSALVPGYFLHLPDAGAVPRRRRDPARAHRVTAVLARVEPDPGNAPLDDLLIRPATQPTTDALAALRHLPEQRTLNNASCVQPFPQQPHRTEGMAIRPCPPQGRNHPRRSQAQLAASRGASPENKQATRARCSRRSCLQCCCS